MTSITKTTLTGAVAALSIGAAVVASTAPAEARYGRNGAFIGGLAAGAIGAGIIANSYRPAYAAPVYGYGAYGGYGAAPAYYGHSCWVQRRPVYDAWGNFAGHRRVRVCN